MLELSFQENFMETPFQKLKTRLINQLNFKNLEPNETIEELIEPFRAKTAETGGCQILK